MTTTAGRDAPSSSLPGDQPPRQPQSHATAPDRTQAASPAEPGEPAPASSTAMRPVLTAPRKALSRQDQPQQRRRILPPLASGRIIRGEERPDHGPGVRVSIQPAGIHGPHHASADKQAARNPAAKPCIYTRVRIEAAHGALPVLARTGSQACLPVSLNHGQAEESRGPPRDDGDAAQRGGSGCHQRGARCR